MPDFGIFRGFNSKLFSDKLFAGQLPTQLGTIGSLSLYDVDAQAFFDQVTTAGGTLTTTEKNATNQLVLDMKSNGIWSKMKAIYPMVGASSAACSQNLKSSSFTGSFSSGWTFASTGATPNGTSAYLDTGLNPSINLTYNSRSHIIYSRTNATLSGVQVDSGCVDSLSEQRMSIDINLFGWHGFLRFSNSGQVANVETQRYDGFFIGTRNSSSAKLFRSGSTLGSYNPTDTNMPNRNIYLGAVNNNGTASNFCNREYAFFAVGDGLTDTEASDFYTAVQAFQTTLSRNV